MEYRFRLSKGREVKYISQLDFARTIERALRRAKLKVKYSQGYNKKPIIIYGPALAVGITSDAEYLDVEFEEILPEEFLKRQLNNVLPEGLRVLHVRQKNGLIPLHKLNRSIFTVELFYENNIGKEALEKAIEGIKKSEEIYVKKKTHEEEKLVNIAPLIHGIFLEEFKLTQAQIVMELSTGQGGSANPFMIIPLIVENIGEATVYIHRNETFFEENGKRIFPM
ncbi:MAG: TIGR03936 family radical SAM-associated protein [Thermovenabulum sp.]|uniref:TIGR03936 family radical SAM-associated protein n=1 Tax=Thermovenabulum sp. TaxID=3100335 RepID=UPI003C7ED7BF